MMSFKTQTTKWTCLIFICLQFLCYPAWALTTEKNNTAKKKLPVDQVRHFVSVFDHVRKYYVDSIPDDKLFELAIKGMLSNLDPHSEYLDSEAYKTLKSATVGKFGGLGIEVEMRDGYIEVISPIDNTPAQRAGIKPGDKIIKIDNTPVKGMSLPDAVKKMRGPKGTTIVLTIVRKGENKPLEVTLTRDIIKIVSVKGKLLDKYYAYIRISHFQAPTASNMVLIIKKLQKEAGGKIKGLILDLRNNPGGLLDSAVAVADKFLDVKSQLPHKQLIVYTKGRLPGAQIHAKATTGDILKNEPMVVLINSGSASGSEIVAGALQDHKRAIVIGQKTFGKGSVQTVLPLGKERAIKLTTALYYTPAGRNIQAKGIEPDIIIDNISIPEKKSKSVLDIISVRESQLKGHIENGSKLKKPKPAKPGSVAKKADKKKLLIHRDFQLYEALNILKAINVAKRTT